MCALSATDDIRIPGRSHRIPIVLVYLSLDPTAELRACGSLLPHLSHADSWRCGLAFFLQSILQGSEKTKMGLFVGHKSRQRILPFCSCFPRDRHRHDTQQLSLELCRVDQYSTSKDSKRRHHRLGGSCQQRLGWVVSVDCLWEYLGEPPLSLFALNGAVFQRNRQDHPEKESNEHR